MNQRWYHVPPQSRSADAPGGSTELQCVDKPGGATELQCVDEPGGATELQCVDESGVRRCRHRVAGCCSAQTDAPARAPLQSCVFCGRHFFYIGSRWLLAAGRWPLAAGRRAPGAGRRVPVPGVGVGYNVQCVM
jgi:hypothetical protein